VTREGGGTSSRTVLLGFFALIALAVGIFIVVYLKLLGYERVAARHIPEGAEFAVRVDLRQVILFAPIREHVVPVLLGAPSETKDQESQLEKVRAATGVNLGMDVFELVVVSRGADVAIVVGGRLPRSGVVEGLAKLSMDAPLRGCTLVAKRLACSAPGVVLEQAEDGALIAATSPRLLDQMLPPGTAYRELGINPEDAAGAAWVVASDVLADAPLGAWGAAPELAALARIEGRLELGDPVRARFEAVPRAGETVAGLAPKLESLRPILQTLLAFGPGRDFGGERAVLSRLRFGTKGDRATAEAEWQRSEMDQAARSLGAMLGAWLGTHAK
jgi:hypothetical protein